MSKIKVLAGDFLENSSGSFSFGSFTLRTKAFDFVGENIPASDIATVEIATEENVKRFAGTVGWGAAGALLLGPLGLLAGLLAGGKGKDIVFIVQFKDGRKLLALTDSKTFTKIQAIAFKNTGNKYISHTEPIEQTVDTPSESTTATSSINNKIEKLIKLKDMLDAGLITEEEFKKYKNELESSNETVTSLSENHNEPTPEQTNEYNETTHHIHIDNIPSKKIKAIKKESVNEKSDMDIIMKKIVDDGYTFISPITVKQNNTDNTFFVRQGDDKVDLMQNGKIIKTYTK